MAGPLVATAAVDPLVARGRRPQFSTKRLLARALNLADGIADIP